MSVSAVTKEIEQHLRKVQIFEAAVRTFFKIGVLENFAIVTVKHLCWGLFIIKLLALKRECNEGVFL